MDLGTLLHSRPECASTPIHAIAIHRLQDAAEEELNSIVVAYHVTGGHESLCMKVINPYDVIHTRQN